MLMGAAHNALWAFNARVSLTLPVCHRPQAATLVLRSGAVRSPVTVVPSCGLETRSWRTGRMARHKQECIHLPYGDIADPYFCYPVNAKPIGFEGCILYCFLPEYGEMVFACNPESCVDQNVYPLAANFEDFIRLILACGTANPLEQIVWMDKNKFEEHMANEEKILTDEQRTAAQQLQRALSLLPIENPFEYVKSIQKDFDGSKIQYSDEYYEVTGIENPKGTNTQDKHLVEFEPVVFEFNRKQDSD